MSEVSCDWWSADHVTTILTLIGPGLRQRRENLPQQLRAAVHLLQEVLGPEGRQQGGCLGNILNNLRLKKSVRKMLSVEL